MPTKRRADSGDESEQELPSRKSRAKDKKRTTKVVSGEAVDNVVDDDDKSSKKQPSKKEPKAPAEADLSGGIHTDNEGNKYVDLGKRKRAQVNSFKGTTYLNLREYWGNDENDLKPGKKGITLSLEQWEILKNNAATIDEMFKVVK